MAASVLAVLWLIAILVFGLLIHLLDKETFSSFGDGAWWATQTVTTVGYGDIVPADRLGKAVAMVLMVGGLSFFAVITGLITTEFITRANEKVSKDRDDAITTTLASLREELASLREELAVSRGQAAAAPGPPAGPPHRPPEG